MTMVFVYREDEDAQGKRSGTTSIDIWNGTRRLGREIRGLRKARGYTLAVLAERSKLSVGYLSLLERNLATPSINSLHQISRAIAHELVIEGGVAAGNRFQPIIEIEHHFVEGEVIGQQCNLGLGIM